jgi:hypothetical protein
LRWIVSAASRMDTVPSSLKGICGSSAAFRIEEFV